MQSTFPQHIAGYNRLIQFAILLPFIVAFFFGVSQIPDTPAEKGTPQAIILTTKGAIGPAVADYVVREIERASADQVKMVVYQIDTPGGLDQSMRDIIRAILSSPIPVITYVAPDGARAASAGTYILYASHIAAMSPATNLGAATPIQIGGIPGTPKSPEKEEKNGKNGEEGENTSTDNTPGTTLEKKIVNDASAYIKSLAERHGRNSEWAVKAVRQAVSLSAAEALKLRVVDIVATDVDDLFRQVDGREVRLETGTATISTENLTIIHIPQTWKDKVLAVISDPNIAYILMLLGVYGLIYELANPGSFLPGVAGVISLILALYAFQVLPINYSGLALIVIGIAFITGEAFMPSFGVLGIGGIISFAVGSFILMDEESMRVSFSVIAGTTATSAAFILWITGRMIAMRGKKIRTGSEAIIGMTGEAIYDFEENGRIWLRGESWQAKTQGKVKKGERVKVTDQEGLELTVIPFEEEP